MPTLDEVRDKIEKRYATALGQALMLLQTGGADVALAGGVEACVTLGIVKAWEAMRVMADDTCRPFSKGRRGLVLGEGAGVFVLETLEHAQARGAHFLAVFGGAGLSADAADIVMPDAGGAARPPGRDAVPDQQGRPGAKHALAEGSAAGDLLFGEAA